MNFLYNLWHKYKLSRALAEGLPLYLFLDDIRKAPSSKWIVIRDPEIMIDVILGNWTNIRSISLDHDLGHRLTGYDVMREIERTAYETDTPVMFTIYVHSSNPVGRERILATIRSMIRRQMYF